MDGCQECGMVYSLVFRFQYHKTGCTQGKREASDRAAMASVLSGPSVPVRSHNCEAEAVPYESTGALGHGWECGVCGKFLQAG